MISWEQMKLRDVSILITKGTTPTTLGYKFTESGINYVKSESVTENGRIDKTKFVFIDQSTHEALKRSILAEDDILFSMAGMFIGKTAVVSKDILPANTNQAVGIIRLDKTKADPRFIHYFLHNKSYTQYINNLVSQSAQPNLNLAEIGNLPISLPPLHEQRTIVSILRALDDKIDLNHRIIRTLEAMARAVFRQWFVENEEVTSWKVGKLGDVAENVRRSANADEIDPKTHYIGLEHMPRGSIALSEWGNASELASNKFVFKEGEFLFGKLRPYFHKVGIAPIDGVCSTDILVIAPKSPEWYGFVLGHISSVELINYTNAASTGTKMPRTNWSDIANYEVAIPPVEKSKEFSEMLLPMAQQIRANIMQSRTLGSLRDSLLPRMMRGEVRV
jgi:type I restriction enzyme S subunit